MTKGKSQITTFLVFYVLQIIVFILGVLLIIKGVVELSFTFFIGLALLILSGYLRFKYKIRSRRHQRGID